MTTSCDTDGPLLVPFVSNHKDLST